MKKISYFLYYLLIDFFGYSIVLGLLFVLLGEALAKLFGVVGFCSILLIAWWQVNKRFSSKKNVNYLHKNNNINSNRTISFTKFNSYDDDTDIQESKWHGYGEKIEMNGLKILNPLIYTLNSGKTSACHVIPMKLKIDDTENFDDLGYWPSYSNLNPGQRNIFIKWLSNGKFDSSINIGYIFLWFGVSNIRRKKGL